MLRREAVAFCIFCGLFIYFYNHIVNAGYGIVTSATDIEAAECARVIIRTVPE